MIYTIKTVTSADLPAFFIKYCDITGLVDIIINFNIYIHNFYSELSKSGFFHKGKSGFSFFWEERGAVIASQCTNIYNRETNVYDILPLISAIPQIFKCNSFTGIVEKAARISRLA